MHKQKHLVKVMVKVWHQQVLKVVMQWQKEQKVLDHLQIIKHKMMVGKIHGDLHQMVQVM